jgi:hypothetical protein
MHEAYLKSFRIEERNGDLCVVFQRVSATNRPNELVCNLQELKERIRSLKITGQETDMSECALVALHARIKNAPSSTIH